MATVTPKELKALIEGMVKETLTSEQAVGDPRDPKINARRLARAVGPAPTVVSKEYPELQRVSNEIAKKVFKAINEAAPKIKSEMPYKAQYILEELIKVLQDAV